MQEQDTPLRLVFAGTPNAAVPSLSRLAAGRHVVDAVITRPDAPLGRKRILTPSPVSVAATAAGIEVITASRLDASVTARIEALAPDLGVIVAYGALVREPLLSLPRLGWINLHFSVLPRWRGAAPVQRAIIAGDRQTGAAVFQLVAELDAGDVFAQLVRPVGPTETAGDVLDALAISGADLLENVISDLADGTAASVPQSGEVTLAPKLTLEDAHIDFRHSAERVDDRIRGVTPEPGAYAMVDGARLKILAARIAGDSGSSAACSLSWDGKRLLVGTSTMPVELVTVQPAGKRPMSAADWWRGLPNRATLVAA